MGMVGTTDITQILIRRSAREVSEVDGAARAVARPVAGSAGEHHVSAKEVSVARGARNGLVGGLRQSAVIVGRADHHEVLRARIPNGACRPAVAAAHLEA